MALSRFAPAATCPYDSTASSPGAAAAEVEPDIDKIVEALAGTAGITRKRIGLRTVLPAVLHDLRALITITDARIEWRDARPVVFGDRELLSQALRNIIANAIIHCDPDRTPNVVIDVCRRPDFVEVSISDNSRGIGADDLEQMWIPRRRGSPERWTMGLAVARRAIELQGGTIGASSTPGVGSVFTLRLPRAR